MPKDRKNKLIRRKIRDRETCVDVLEEMLEARGTTDDIEYCDRIELSNESPELELCEIEARIAHLGRLLDCPDPIRQSCVDDSCLLYECAVSHCEELYGS